MAARRQAQAPKDETPKETLEAPPPAPGEPVEVDLSSEEDDDAPEEEPQLSRREKKRERQSLREQAERDREARLQAEMRAAQAIGYAQATVQQTQQREPQRAPHDIESDAIFRERELLVQEFQHARQRSNGQLTPEQEQDFKRRGYQLEERMAMNAAAKREAAIQQHQPQQGNDVMAVLRARYPEVVSNPQAFDFAISRYRTLIRDPRDPQPDNWDTAERVMQETREAFGMAGQRQNGNGAPEPRRRFEGSPAGASGTRQGSPSKITLTPDDVKAATAAYPHLPEAERNKRYAQVRQRSEKKAS
jgi:hypothetical protein